MADYAYIIQNQRILKCKVVKKTPKTVVVWPVHIESRKRTFKNEDRKVFYTWHEAHAAMLEAAEQEVADARLHLAQVKGRAGQIRGMKPPEDLQP